MKVRIERHPQGNGYIAFIDIHDRTVEVWATNIQTLEARIEAIIEEYLYDRP